MSTSDFNWEQLRDRVRERIARNESITARLPGGGRLRIDRQLPFLLVYRSPSQADAGTADLVTTEAAYLIAPGATELASEVNGLCHTIVLALQQHCGTVLLVEIWAADLQFPQNDGPAFEIVSQEADTLPQTVDAIRDALERISMQGQQASVRVTTRTIASPPGLSPLLTGLKRHDSDSTPSARCVLMGLAVRPIYWNSTTGGVFPLILQRLRRRLSVALRQAIFKFTDMESQLPQLHFDSLGPSTLRKSADRVDRQLCEIASSFDFLLQVSPANSEQAWRDFQHSGYKAMPRLYYRPLPDRPSLLKRKLFAIRTEHVEDPTLAWLFTQKQVELDRQITALRDIDTPLFRYSSLQLFGQPDEQLVQLADSILGVAPQGSDSDTDRSALLDAAAIATQARCEIDAYRREQPAFEARIEISDGVPAGLMVAGDRLLISTSLRVPPHRVVPLLQHEVGTHLLTYFNGRSQPLRLLAAGLASCEGLQEGLAVLAEYFSGGLSAGRLRVLAARVIAVSAMLQGASFEDTYDRLANHHGLQPHVAFATTLRSCRAGGLTKDVVYLRGLQGLLRYLGQGNDLEPLYVGKLALQHVPFVQELRRRGIVRAPLLLPRFWNFAEFRSRLDDCRRKTVMDLMHEAWQASTTRNTGVVA